MRRRAGGGQEENACDGADPRGTERLGRVLLQPERHRSLSPAAGKEERQIWGTGGRVRRGAARGGRIPARPANGGEGERRRRPARLRLTRQWRRRPSRGITASAAAANFFGRFRTRRVAESGRARSAARRFNALKQRIHVRWIEL